MKQASLVIKTQSPIIRKYPGVPKEPENLSKVPMVSYPEKNREPVRIEVRPSET